MNFFDPYYIIDPTRPISKVAHQGRSYSGRFTHNSIFTGAGDDNFPIDSPLWARYARGAWKRLARSNDDPALPDLILPPNVTDLFSWRMTCEMVEAACKQAERTPNDIESIVFAAHNYLADAQDEIIEKIRTMEELC